MATNPISNTDTRAAERTRQQQTQEATRQTQATEKANAARLVPPAAAPVEERKPADPTTVAGAREQALFGDGMRKAALDSALGTFPAPGKFAAAALAPTVEALSTNIAALDEQRAAAASRAPLLQESIQQLQGRPTPLTAAENGLLKASTAQVTANTALDKALGARRAELDGFRSALTSGNELTAAESAKIGADDVAVNQEVKAAATASETVDKNSLQAAAALRDETVQSLNGLVDPQNRSPRTSDIKALLDRQSSGQQAELRDQFNKVAAESPKAGSPRDFDAALKGAKLDPTTYAGLPTQTHVVREGDTLWDIASHTVSASGQPVTLDELRAVEANKKFLDAADPKRNANGDYIYPTDVVTLPPGARYVEPQAAVVTPPATQTAEKRFSEVEKASFERSKKQMETIDTVRTAFIKDSANVAFGDNGEVDVTKSTAAIDAAVARTQGYLGKVNGVAEEIKTDIQSLEAESSASPGQSALLAAKQAQHQQVTSFAGTLETGVVSYGKFKTETGDGTLDKTEIAEIQTRYIARQTALLASAQAGSQADGAVLDAHKLRLSEDDNDAAKAVAPTL